MTHFTFLNEAALTKYASVLGIFKSSTVRQRGKKKNTLDYVTRDWNEVDEAESIISYQSVLSLPRSWPKCACPLWGILSRKGLTFISLRKKHTNFQTVCLPIGHVALMLQKRGTPSQTEVQKKKNLGGGGEKKKLWA